MPWDTLGCYGNRLIRTPRLDRLAAEGTVFDRAYCESPICMPSRVTLLTGKRASHHGVKLHNTRMRPDERTLAHACAEHGYLTHAVGKLHLMSQVHPGNPESVPDWRAGLYDNWRGPYAGFQTTDMILGHSNSLYGHYGAWLRREHPGQCHRFWEQNMRKLPVACGQGVFDNDIPEDLHSTAWCADRAIDAMRQAAETGRPFFLHVGFPDPHWPIIPPPRWFHLHDDVTIPDQPPFPDDLDRYPRLFRGMREGTLPERNPYDGGGHLASSETDVAAITRAYWGSIACIDHHVGRMLDGLQALGLADDTLVVFTTDHGEYMGDHGLMAKGGFMYESFLRVPFLARLPGRIPAGARQAGLLSFLDVPATMASLCSFDPALNHEGYDQAEAWCGGASPRRRLDITHFTHAASPDWGDQRTLITDDGWKLTFHPGDDLGELYHLPSDPGERRNRWSEPADRPQRERLIRDLLDSICLGRDRQPEHDRRVGMQRQYNNHVMTPAVWEPEMAQLAAAHGAA